MCVDLMLNNLTNYLGGLPGSSLASSKLWQFLVKHTMTQTLIEVRYHTETPTKNEERTFFEGFPKVNNNSSKHCEPGVKSKYINKQNPLFKHLGVDTSVSVRRVILRSLFKGRHHLRYSSVSWDPDDQGMEG